MHVLEDVSKSDPIKWGNMPYVMDDIRYNSLNVFIVHPVFILVLFPSLITSHNCDMVGLYQK